MTHASHPCHCSMRIDAHTHTLFSDGTDTPRELLMKAKIAGLDMVGLTDHDTVDGWAEAVAAVNDSGVALIRGTEVSCRAHVEGSQRGYTVHMLSYLHHPDDQGMAALFRETKRNRVERIRLMVQRIAEDYPISLDDVYAQAREGVAIGRPHIADALVGAGCFPNRNACFETVLNNRSPYYVPYQAPDAVDVVRTIRQAGGVPVYAHPRAAHRQRLVPSRIIRQMVDAGLFGLEAYHRDHSDEWVAAVETMAKHFGLEVTGSSDYHGLGKPNLLGENLTDWAVVKRIEEQGALDIVWPRKSACETARETAYETARES